jgi:hypothetical protein
MSETIDLNNATIKQAIQDAVNEATKGLIAKRDELLNEVKKLRKDSQIDPADYQRLKDEKEELTDKLNETTKAAKAALSEAEKERKLREGESGYVQKLLIDNGLTDALTKAGIKPELLKATKALFKDQAQIKIDGDNRAALIGDKPITDFINEWAKSDEGKHFVLAPANSGGGAQGGGSGNLQSKQLTRSQFDGMNPGEKMSFSKAGGKIVD